MQIKNTFVRWAVVVCLIIIHVIDIPFRINVSYYYIFYFLLGYEIQKYALVIREQTKPFYIAILWIGFFLLFIFSQFVFEQIDDIEVNNGALQKVLLFEAKTIIRVIYSTIGLLALYLTSLKVVNVHSLPDYYVDLGQYCFGVYLFQQFILKILYYKTDFPSLVGSMALPWFGFAIALFISLVLSFFIRRTNIGKRLI